MDWLILVLSLVAGVAGTGIGGIIGALLKNRGARTMGKVLGFAGGVMAGVVAFEMIPEAIASTVEMGKIGGIATAVGTTVAGMAVIYGVNKLLDFIEKKRRSAMNDVYRASGVVQAYSRMGHCFTLSESAQASVMSKPTKTKTKKTDSASTKSAKAKAESDFAQHAPQSLRKEMIKAGTIMLIAIALHNFPEGMAIGATGTLEIKTGILVALIIAIHNVPEGMAISAPLVSGGVKGIKAVLLAALAGGATVIGALFGLAVGGLGEIATGICLALASGAMLYVTFCDILPQSIVLNGGEVPSATFLAGIIFAIVFVFII